MGDDTLISRDLLFGLGRLLILGMRGCEAGGYIYIYIYIYIGKQTIIEMVKSVRELCVSEVNLISRRLESLHRNIEVNSKVVIVISNVGSYSSV